VVSDLKRSRYSKYHHLQHTVQKRVCNLHKSVIVCHEGAGRQHERERSAPRLDSSTFFLPWTPDDQLCVLSGCSMAGPATPNASTTDQLPYSAYVWLDQRAAHGDCTSSKSVAPASISRPACHSSIACCFPV
jgi:hypothetical protein